VKEAPDAIRLSLGESADGAIAALKQEPPQKLAVPPVILVGDKATVEGLAKLLGAIAYRDLPATSLKRARP
jgi:hypothetical protein